MGFGDIPDSAGYASEQIRSRVRATATLSAQNVRAINGLVAKFGRPAIGTALGADANALLTYYGQMKAFAEAVLQITLPDLP